MHGQSVAVIGDNAYIFGGHNGAYLSAIYKYNFISGTLNTLDVALSTGSHHHFAIALDDTKIMILGGDKSGGRLKSTFIFDTATNDISNGPSLNDYPNGLSSLRAFTLDGKIYVVGGYTNSNASSWMYRLSDDKTSWIKLGNFPEEIHGQNFINANGTIYSIAGSNTERYIQGVYKYNVGNDSWAREFVTGGTLIVKGNATFEGADSRE